jgi:hypothetical protein
MGTTPREAPLTSRVSKSTTTYALLLRLYFPPFAIASCEYWVYTAIQDFELSFDVQQDGVNFVDDGIRIEPFNLEREREEGYFDENGNFVEYARGNEIKVMKILCLAPLMSFEKLLLVTQAPVFVGCLVG